MSGRVGISCKPKRQPDDGRVSALEACNMAAEFVKQSGLALAWTSTKSEACYYRCPGRWGVLRIATHVKGGKNERGHDGPTLVCLTFPEANLRGFIPCHVENHAATGIGLYLIRAKRQDS